MKRRTVLVLVLTSASWFGCDWVNRPEVRKSGGPCDRSGGPTIYKYDVPQPVGSAVGVSVGVPQSSCPPRPVQALKVTCEGESCQVSDVKVDDGNRFFVTASKPGVVTVTTSFVDPGTKKPGTLQTTIAFAEGRLVPLAVGAPKPASKKIVSFKDPAGVQHTCKALASHQQDGWKVKAPKQTETFLCYGPKEIFKGMKTLQLVAQMTDQMPTHVVCVARDDKGVVKMVQHAVPSEVGKYGQKKMLGDLPPGVACGW